MQKEGLLELWGVRGTAPAAGPDKVRFGGHTICSRVRTADNEEPIVIDAGSGMIPLGRRFWKEREGRKGTIHLLLTHFHLDHILGLPFFDPLYQRETRLVIHTPIEPDEAERCLGGLMAGRIFPVELREVPAKLEFRKFPKEGLSLSGCRISACPLHHPQGSVAYRVEQGGRAWVAATDTEHPAMGIDAALADFCRGAEALICDATYLPKEYPDKRGWGHSTWEAGVLLAEAAGIERLILSHLNPEHDDDVVAAMEREARERFPGARAAVEATAEKDVIRPHGKDGQT